jgi:hypothetical protein
VPLYSLTSPGYSVTGGEVIGKPGIYIEGNGKDCVGVELADGDEPSDGANEGVVVIFNVADGLGVECDGAEDGNCDGDRLG